MNACVHRIGVVPEDRCAQWLDLIDRSYAAVRGLKQESKNFSVRSSSMRLFSVPGIDVERLGAFARELYVWCERELGAPVALNVDQCWVRRQYAPGNYPRLHAPHSWHQDGALGFDFQACGGRQPPPEALLEMVTCWIALTPCGIEAPGLELMTGRTNGLLRPDQLTDPQVRERFAAEEFVRPAMQPCDALLFRGSVLHRTYVTPEMTNDRTSVELRFFAADRIPERLFEDHFV